MSVVGALSTHRHLVLPKSHRRREGGLPDCAVARMLPSGLWTQGSKEHNTEATSVTSPPSSHSTKYRQWFSRLSKDAAACRAHLSAIATTSAVWPEKCRWGRAVVGVGPADAVLGSTMTAATSTRDDVHGGGNSQANGAGRSLAPAQAYGQSTHKQHPGSPSSRACLNRTGYTHHFGPHATLQ
jgi:hypothetical protein